MAINTTSIAHIRLTVTDIERSRQFYESVFGWPITLELPEGADETTREMLGFLFGGVIYDLADFGLDREERRRSLRFYVERFGVHEES